MTCPMVLCTSNWLHGSHFSQGSRLCESSRDSDEDTPSKASGPSIDHSSPDIPIGAKGRGQNGEGC